MRRREEEEKQWLEYDLSKRITDDFYEEYSEYEDEIDFLNEKYDTLFCKSFIFEISIMPNYETLFEYCHKKHNGFVLAKFINQNAEISLYGSNLKLKGKVSLIRSRIGRLSTGSDITPLLPINMYREAQVRVAIDKAQGPSQNPGNLCYSGYTGKVTFLQ